MNPSKRRSATNHAPQKACTAVLYISGLCRHPVKKHMCHVEEFRSKKKSQVHTGRGADEQKSQIVFWELNNSCCCLVYLLCCCAERCVCMHWSFDTRDNSRAGAHAPLRTHFFGCREREKTHRPSRSLKNKARNRCLYLEERNLYVFLHGENNGENILGISSPGNTNAQHAADYLYLPYNPGSRVSTNNVTTSATQHFVLFIAPPSDIC